MDTSQVYLENRSLFVFVQRKVLMIESMILSASPTVRSHRPSSVKLRVGQVVKHKLYGYHGVITGWDEIARAPDRWLNEHHRNHPVSNSKL